eukprot:1859383-Prymnesium_polylepis.1
MLLSGRHQHNTHSRVAQRHRRRSKQQQRAAPLKHAAAHRDAWRRPAAHECLKPSVGGERQVCQLQHARRVSLQRAQRL